MVTYTEITNMKNKSTGMLKVTAIISFTNLPDYCFFSFKVVCVPLSHFLISSTNQLSLSLKYTSGILMNASSLQLEYNYTTSSPFLHHYGFFSHGFNWVLDLILSTWDANPWENIIVSSMKLLIIQNHLGIQVVHL
jgi:hypothetical protein